MFDVISVAVVALPPFVSFGSSGVKFIWLVADTTPLLCIDYLYSVKTLIFPDHLLANTIDG